MIEQLIPYLADSLPGLFVAFVMAYYMLKRMSTLENRICDMLDKCMTSVLEQIERDKL